MWKKIKVIVGIVGAIVAAILLHGANIAQIIQTIPMILTWNNQTISPNINSNLEPTIQATDNINNVQKLISHNSDWTPIERQFNGILMVLVPSGCFEMGKNGEGGKQCFPPFWIDKTEVTQQQFKNLDGVRTTFNDFIGENRPVHKITWFEANAFCILRGGASTK